MANTMMHDWYHEIAYPEKVTDNSIQDSRYHYSLVFWSGQTEIKQNSCNLVKGRLDTDD